MITESDPMIRNIHLDAPLVEHTTDQRDRARRTCAEYADRNALGPAGLLQLLHALALDVP